MHQTLSFRQPNTQNEMANKYLTIEEGTIPFPRPLIKKAALAFKNVQSSSGEQTRTVLQCENGQLFEIGIELKDARYGKVHRIYALQRIETASAEIYRRTSEKFVVKKLSKQLILHNRDRCENPVSEIGALQYLSALADLDQNCLSAFASSYCDCYNDFDTIYVISSFFDCGDLLDVIDIRNKRQSEITLSELRDMFSQIANQLSFLHANGIVHRDLSLENVLFDQKSNIFSIIDYGMAIRLKETGKQTTVLDDSASLSSSSMMDEESSCGGFDDTRLSLSEDDNEYAKWAKISQYIVCGKNQYIAPELWRHEKELQMMKVDIWSLGIVFFMMFFLRAPFEVASLKDKHFRIYQEKQDLFALIQRMFHSQDFQLNQEEMQLVDLIESMMKVDPKERMTISEVLAHPFFQQ